MAHKKKEKKKDAKVKTDLPALSDIPAFFPAPGIGRLALNNPVVMGALIGYTIAEKTQQFWGPTVEAHARRTRDRFRKDTSTSIDPSSPWNIPEGYGFDPSSLMDLPPQTMTPSEQFPPVKRPRATSKANKATKEAWKLLLKGRKGKLTKKACQQLLKKASMMASKANPNTKSRIGKAKNGTTRACKKIRKTIWGQTKRNK